MAGDEDWAEPVEIIDGEESTVEIEGGRTIDWHRLVRTGAAVVAATALVWIGRSIAAEARAQERSTCSSNIGNAYWRYENALNRQSNFDPRGVVVPEEVFTELAASARECGDDLLADAFEFERRLVLEDDD